MNNFTFGFGKGGFGYHESQTFVDYQILNYYKESEIKPAIHLLNEVGGQ